MTDQLQQDTNAYIESCLDVNGSWRDVFNDLAILHTLDLELDIEYSIIGDCILEEMTDKGHEICGRDLEGLVTGYMNEFAIGIHPSWFSVEYNLDYATELVLNSGADEDCINDFISANS